MMYWSGNEFHLVQEPRTPDDDDKCHFDIPVGTTLITEDSWEGWGVDKNKLTSVTIPDSVTTIGPWAFAHCKSLAAVTIPSSVTVIERNTFTCCSSLLAVKIPSSVTVIESEAFSYCDALEEVTIPSSVRVMGEGTFYYCKLLKEVTILGSVTIVNSRTFAFCDSLTRVIIPNSVTRIESMAFYWCNSLEEMTIPESVTYIAKDVSDYRTLRFINYGIYNSVAELLVLDKRFHLLNKCKRTARVRLEKKCGVAQFTWSAGTDTPEITKMVLRIPLIDLGGNEYPVYVFWDADHPTADFKALAAAQHPKALGKINLPAWAFALPDADATVDTLDLAVVASMIARGELPLDEPWLLVWKSDENEKASE